MASEILVNDGGAPSRILPFEAGEDIIAGDALSIDTSGKVVKADTDLAAGHIEYMVGVALVTTASGEICSVVTGKGVIVRCNTTDVTAGKALKVGSTAGRLTATTVLGHTCAVCLEDTGAAGLHKCLVIGG